MTDETRQSPAETVSHGRCPRCNSPKPHLHPAVQVEGEVQPCAHAFHSIVTNQNPAPALNYWPLSASQRPDDGKSQS